MQKNLQVVDVTNAATLAPIELTSAQLLQVGGGWGPNGTWSGLAGSTEGPNGTWSGLTGSTEGPNGTWSGLAGSTEGPNGTW